MLYTIKLVAQSDARYERCGKITALTFLGSRVRFHSIPKSIFSVAFALFIFSNIFTSMDGGEPSPTHRKLKFAPKAPPKRKPKPPASNSEAGDEQHEDSAQAQALLRRWNENVARREPKERKSNVQVAFGPGDNSSPPLRTYGVSEGVNRGKGSGSASKEDFPNEQSALARSSTAIEDKSDACMIRAPEDTTKASAWKNKRDYKEPWDYHNSYYPTTLPLRKPYSGDPEILDEEEFGEAATSKEYDENTVNSAEELGLLEKSEQQRMLLFKLPPALPLVKQSVSRKGNEKVSTSTISGGSTKGYMGKMLVYKSGAIKLKLGETLFDVSPGSNATFAQDVVAINTAQKHCCILGELGQMAVATPDLDSVEL